MAFIKVDKIKLIIIIVILITFFVSICLRLTLPCIIFFSLLTIVTNITHRYFMIYSYKLYLVIIALILLVSSGLIAIWSPSYSPNNAIYNIIPICGFLLVAISYSFNMKYASLIIQSVPLIETGKFKEAVEKIDKLMKSNLSKIQPYPNRQILFFHKVVALNNCGNRIEALNLIDELIEEGLNEKIEISVLNYKFIILLGLRRYDDAEEMIDLILDKDPENHLTLLNEALFLYKIGCKEDAAEAFEDLLNETNEKLSKFKEMMFPENIWNMELTQVFERIRSPKEFLNMELTDMLMQKSAIHERLHQYKEELECLNEILELNPERLPAWSMKGYVLAHLGKYDEALKCVNKSLELYSRDIYSLDIKGFILAHSGKPDDALKYYQKALEIDSLFEEAYYHKGEAHKELKQYTEALQCFKKVLELNPYCDRAKEDIEQISGQNQDIS